MTLRSDKPLKRKNIGYKNQLGYNVFVADVFAL